jgi:hypothetical protein
MAVMPGPLSVADHFPAQPISRSVISRTSFPKSSGRKIALSKPWLSKDSVPAAPCPVKIQMGTSFTHLASAATSSRGFSLSKRSAIRSCGKSFIAKR